MSADDSLLEFARLIEGSGLRLGLRTATLPPTRRPGKTDTLFHLPLLAVCIMVISSLGLLRTEELGRQVAHLLIEYFRSLRDVGTLEWSITLRRRCAEALSFLEMAGLVKLGDGDQRDISLTPDGKRVLSVGLRDESDVGQLARGLVRSQSRAKRRLGGG